ncbi:hypothetical protein M2131_000062 [Polynucleobacter sphagniphilus]|nr:hypothetical protein [Polynucleobacter sphagniphilus]
MTFDPSTIFAFFFYAFAGLLVLSAVRVITARNPVHAALFLVFGLLLCIWFMDAIKGGVFESGTHIGLCWRRHGALLVCSDDVGFGYRASAS